MGTLMKILECLDAYIASRDNCGEYNQILRGRVIKFVAWAGVEEVGQVTEHMINAWLTHLKDSGLTPVTINGYRANLLSLLNAASDDGVRPYLHSRKIKRIKSQEIIPDGWSQQEVTSLLDYCRQIDGYYTTGIKASYYWMAVVLVAYDTGLRRGDILHLKVDDISTDGRYIIQRKTRRRHRIAVNKSTYDMFQRTLPPDRDLAFPWPYNATTFSKKFIDIARGAGLRGSFKFLRSGSGSEVESEKPGAGAKHLGHTGVHVFQKHYDVEGISRGTLSLPPEIRFQL